MRSVLMVAVMGLVGGWLAAGVVASRGAIGAVRHPGGAPALPSRVAISGPVPAEVSRQPAGPAIAVYLDDDDDTQWWVFVSAYRSSYRKLAAGSFFPGSRNGLLLSPDGSMAAVTAGGSGAGHVSVLHLVSGDVRRVPDLQLAPDDAALAWSPNNSHLALRLGGRLAVADAISGRVTRFDVGAADAAFAPRGDRIAASLTGRLAIVDAVNGQLLSSYPVGNYAVAPAGWSPDGSTIALQPPEGPAALLLARLDLASSRVLPASAETAGRSAVAWRSNSVLVVTAPGRPILTAYDVFSGQLSLLADNTSDWYPTSHRLRLATALVPSATVVTPERVDRGHAYNWYAAWLAAVIVMTAIGRWWPRPSSARRRSGAYLFLIGAMAAGAPIVVVIPLVFFAAPTGVGHLDALGLAGFPYVVGALAAMALLGGAGLLAGLLSRPDAGPVPAPEPRPLITTSG